MGSESCSPIRTDDLNGVSESCRPGTEMGVFVRGGGGGESERWSGKGGLPPKDNTFSAHVPPIVTCLSHVPRWGIPRGQ